MFYALHSTGQIYYGERVETFNKIKPVLVLRIWMYYFEIKCMLTHVNILYFPRCVYEMISFGVISACGFKYTWD